MTWERLRIRSLETGFVAAISVPLLTIGNVWAPLVSTFALTAGGCVTFWIAGLIGSGFLDTHTLTA